MRAVESAEARAHGGHVPKGGFTAAVQVCPPALPSAAERCQPASQPAPLAAAAAPVAGGHTACSSRPCRHVCAAQKAAEANKQAGFTPEPTPREMLATMQQLHLAAGGHAGHGKPPSLQPPRWYALTSPATIRRHMRTHRLQMSCPAWRRLGPSRRRSSSSWGTTPGAAWPAGRWCARCLVPADCQCLRLLALSPIQPAWPAAGRYSCAPA